MLSDSNQRLVKEIRLLQRCEQQFGLRAKPLIDQLVAAADQPLPDLLPSQPQWVEYQWLAGDAVDFSNYWRQMDRGSGWIGARGVWEGPYL